ncbi:hypothetical protein [Streptomyces sp. NPDC058992]|uniref:hypothetical protein n=1 Tax=unclassified Streptomyces TaxID=2593676 RepID=UPI0036C2E692
MSLTVQGHELSQVCILEIAGHDGPLGAGPEETPRLAGAAACILGCHTLHSTSGSDVTDTLQQPDPEMLSAAVIGYYQAVQRFLRDVTRVTEHDDGFAALASATECLFWLCSLEEQMRENDPTYLSDADNYGRRLVQGARWARNQATHQLAFIIAQSDGPQYPQSDAAALVEVVWRPANEMPVPKREYQKQREAYDQYLAGRPVRITFDHIKGFFASEQNRAGSLLNRSTMA